MGWLPWSSGDKNTETRPPVRQDRQKCWESRDAYFTCLDAVGVVKPGDEGNSCSSELKKYEGSCAKSWIDYFNQRRVLAEQQKESLAMANAQAEEARAGGEFSANVIFPTRISAQFVTFTLTLDT